MIPQYLLWLWIGMLMVSGTMLGWMAVCDRSFRPGAAFINVIFGALLVFTAFAAPSDMPPMLANIGLIVACELIAGVITAVILRRRRRSATTSG